MGVTAVWGFTFVMVKEAIAKIPTFQFLSMRFLVAAFVLLAIFPRGARSLRRPTLMAGSLAGLALGAGYALQTLGLQYTGATKAGFITGLAVVFTPPIAALVLKKSSGRRPVAGVAVAAVGLALLTVGTSFDFNIGDLIVLFCAVSFALHIVILGRYSQDHDSRTLTLVQLGLAGVLFSLISLAVDDLEAPDRSVWIALIFTAVGASAIAFLIQTWAQKHLSPTTTAVTFTMEPVFAGLAGFVLLGERLSLRNWMGAVLILTAMLLVSLKSSVGEA